MLNQIALRRLRCWVQQTREPDLLQAKAIGFELGQLGYKFENINEFTATSQAEFAANLDVLKAMRGDNVRYVPLFSNFPDDLPNDAEYLLRRVLGFLGLDTFIDSSRFGADPITQMQRADLWQAAVDAQGQRLYDDRTEWIVLSLVNETVARQKLTQWVWDLVYGATPIKEALWADIFAVIWILDLNIEIEKIQIKETLARLAADRWQKWNQILVRTPTDLLRMLAFGCGQDVTLAAPIDFKGLKLSKPQRRSIVTFLNGCPALAEDLLRYKRLWISVSRWLHPGDWAKQFPAVAKAFDDLRNDRLRSFESLVINSPLAERLEHLAARPSILLRKLTWLMQSYPPETLAERILALEDQVASLPLPLLVTTYFAVKYNGDRFIINKQGKPYVIDRRKPLGDVSAVLAGIDRLILAKLRGSKDWQQVWIDPAIYKLVLPLQARKQSDGLLNLARGARIAVDAEVMRLFVYWHENSDRTDLDLSAMKLDADFKFLEYVGWSNYGTGQDVAHSGDIQSAEMGAAEFIDLRLAALKCGYILPAVLRFTGEGFSSLRACYAGWMQRQQVGADTQTFDAKTVAEKIEVNQDGKVWIPFLLDVAAREIIYVDIYLQGTRVIEGNTHFPALAAALASAGQARPTFGDLADWYVRANGATLVAREEATTTVGMTDDCSVNVLKLAGQKVTSFF
jgi:hypothetical protein